MSKKKRVVSDVEKLVRRLNRRYEGYHRNPGSTCGEPVVDVPGAEGVKFLCVGHNASHGFYLGWDADGNMWHASYCGDDDDRWYVRKMDPGEQIGYIGHY